MARNCERLDDGLEYSSDDRAVTVGIIDAPVVV